MSDRPVGKKIPCPECGAMVFAIVPKNGEITNEEEKADAKVWSRCPDCGERFLVYYRTG